jgi:hypothetical protein
MDNAMKPILVTTKHRGVFAGLVPDDQDMTDRTLALKEARMAIRWGTTKGVAELAQTGPTANSKIGAPADLPALHDVTAIWDISEAAWEKWRSVS